MNACTYCTGSRYLGDVPGNGPCVCAPRPMKITATALAMASLPEVRQVDVFRPATPAPGVVPATAQRAMMAADNSMAQIAAYGGQWGASNNLTFMGYPFLAELAQLPEYRNIVETIAKEMTRKWIKFSATGEGDKSDKITKLEAAFKKYKVQDKFRRMAELDGFFGRAHLYIDIGRDDLKTLMPVDKRKIRPGKLEALRVVEPIWTYPNAYNSTNPLAPDFYRPREWYVMGERIHRSRMLTFVGREVPDVLKPAYAFGGLSTSQMMKVTVDNWLRTRTSVSDITHNFSKTVLATNLSTILQGGVADSLIYRAQLFNQTRDNRGLMMVDKDTEELTDVSSPLGTLDKLQAQAQEQMASIAQIPLVVLLGVTPSGLNASAEGELDVWYARVASWQEDLFGDHLTIVSHVMQLHLFGEIDPDIGYEFVPLGEEDTAARATTRKTEADTDVAYIDAGVIDPAEARARLVADENSPYKGLTGPPPEPPEPDPAEGGPPGEEDDARPGEIADEPQREPA
jgi:phage-related protein (TIGR01555 family)